MAMLVIFCTNSINILAGVNGLEAGQTFVIACAGWGCLAGWDGWIVSSVLATGLLPQDLSSVEIVENIRLFGGPAVLFHNLLALSRGAGDTPEQQDGHLFAAYLMMPLVATTLALLVFNWFPAKVLQSPWCHFRLQAWP